MQYTAQEYNEITKNSMKFEKWDGKRPFQVGDTIRLGGRVAEIKGLHRRPHHPHEVNFSKEESNYWFSLSEFPDIEIAILEPTISEETARFIEFWCKDFYSVFEGRSWVSVESLLNQIHSMVEKK